MSDRIRYVLSDPREETICLNDVIKALVSTSDKFKYLEYKNTIHSLKEAKKALKNAKQKLIEFELRLKNEITSEVMDEVSKRDKSIVYGNPDKLKPFPGNKNK